jgi:N-acetylglucosaminyl-diphospho-decaprenol L-rhamnosyltransferase
VSGEARLPRSGPAVDVVVVSYNSRDRLRTCVEALAGAAGIEVTVVDNASGDDSLGSIADLPVRRLAMARNGGYAYGNNAGWRRGSSPYVLILNPDTVIEASAIMRLVAVLESDPAAGAVGPRILDEDGALDFSQRRFPRLRSTFAQALFLHRLFPRGGWTDEIVRVPARYEHPGSPDWISGACMLVRRSLLEQLGGLDEGYFLYCEDKDLCRRIRAAGFDVRFEPSATCRHIGGRSAPRSALLPVLARSRIRYARLHRGRVALGLERTGIALGALTHALLSTQGRATRAGHVRALLVALGLSRERPTATSGADRSGPQPGSGGPGGPQATSESSRST